MLIIYIIASIAVPLITGRCIARGMGTDQEG